MTIKVNNKWGSDVEDKNKVQNMKKLFALLLVMCVFVGEVYPQTNFRKRFEELRTNQKERYEQKRSEQQ